MRDKPVSTIIVSYNDRAVMGRCLDALTAQCTVPGDEIIVVDNASTDGVRQDLRRRADDPPSPCPRFHLIENGENAGFPVGCNTGFAASTADNDIFLLNNDAVLAADALERLWQALYSAEDIGAAGPVSNNALEQCEPGIRRDASVEEALSFGEGLGARREGSLQARTPYEYRSRLTGFAVLIKRASLDRLIAQDGHFLDPRFSPGYFEDEYLGMRLALAGYRQILCHDAFVYHKGGTGFASHPEAMMRGRQRFIDKWGFDVWDYIGTLPDHEEALRELTKRRGIHSTAPLRVLDLYCGMGVNAAHLQYLYPRCTVIGIEPEPVIAQIAATLIDVICEDPEETLTNAGRSGTPEAAVLRPGTFDLILAWEACRIARDGNILREGLRKLLKPDGLLAEC